MPQFCGRKGPICRGFFVQFPWSAAREFFAPPGESFSADREEFQKLRPWDRNRAMGINAPFKETLEHASIKFAGNSMADLESDPKIGNQKYVDTESFEEQFRDALVRGDELAVAEALRRCSSLTWPTIDALANLLEANADDNHAMKVSYGVKLCFVKTRGRPKTLTTLSAIAIRNAEIATWVAERLSRGAVRKNVIADAVTRFSLSRSTIEAVLRPDAERR
jgi:hypothetical protein